MMSVIVLDQEIMNVKVDNICDKFNDILGGTMHTSEDGICTVMKSRTNIKPICSWEERKIIPAHSTNVYI